MESVSGGLCFAAAAVDKHLITLLVVFVVVVGTVMALVLARSLTEEDNIMV